MPGEPRDYSCIVCYKVFTATRIDAGTCGPTCRQRECRQRKKDREAMARIKDRQTAQERQDIIDADLDAISRRD